MDIEEHELGRDPGIPSLVRAPTEEVVDSLFAAFCDHDIINLGEQNGLLTAGFSEHDPHCMMHVCDLQRVALEMDDAASSSNESIFARSQGEDSRSRTAWDVQGSRRSHLRSGSHLR